MMSRIMKDLYKVLGLERQARPEEIKRAYRKMTLEWHPDKHGNSPESEQRFKEINIAYSILSDVKKRKEYDEIFDIKRTTGFDPDTGAFDPSDLEEEEFVKNFVHMFGEYLDQRFPGFKKTVEKAAKEQTNKKTKKKTSQKNDKKYKCNKCKDTKKIKFKQGDFIMMRKCPYCT